MADATIMIVDDDAEIRNTVGLLLKKADYHVIQAVDGREAIALLSAAPEGISTILVDLQMPNVNGVEVIRHLKALYPTVPFIVMTANPDFLLTEVLAKDGVCDYLIKPFPKEKLLESVRIAVRLHRLRKDQSPTS
jgi:DNA-binding NtrC family response regulator